MDPYPDPASTLQHGLEQVLHLCASVFVICKMGMGTKLLLGQTYGLVVAVFLRGQGLRQDFCVDCLEGDPMQQGEEQGKYDLERGKIQ